MALRFRLTVCAILFARLVLVATVRGQETTPQTGAAQASGEELTYEEQRLRSALERKGLERVSPQRAEGLKVAFVEVARDDVFVEGEGPLSWFTWANIFHWLTDADIIRRELLLERGEPYRHARAEESMRNLRSLGIFTYVRVVPVEAEQDGEVGLLAYTRDLWSLRIETNFQVTGDQVDLFQLQLTERNLLGRNKQGTARFFLFPATYSVGQQYLDRRLFGSRVSLLESGDLIFNRFSGELEGGQITAGLRKPFYNLAQRFGFEIRGTYSTAVGRDIQNGEILTYDIPETEVEEEIPRVWRDQSAKATVLGRFRRGAGYRQTFGLGWQVRDRQVEPNEETGLEPGQRDPFRRDVLPRARREIGPVFRYDLFTPTFRTYENLGTFGQSENVRSGPEVTLQMRLPLEAFGSSSDSAVFDAKFSYVLARGDGIAKAELIGESRIENGRVVDQRLRAELRGATPTLGFVRLVGRLVWDGRRNDTSRTLVSLGGDNGLRGFVSQAFVNFGGSLFRGNFEIRTIPLELWSVHVGGVLFYDFGTVYGAKSEAEFHHGVGIGLRLLLPQFNRTPFAFDAAAPMGERFQVVPSIRANQAVPLTPLDENLLEGVNAQEQDPTDVGRLVN
jgi:hypothetical protein